MTICSQIFSQSLRSNSPFPHFLAIPKSTSFVAFNKLPLCTKPRSASGMLLLRAAIKYMKKEEHKSKSEGNAGMQHRDPRGDAAPRQALPIAYKPF